MKTRSADSPTAGTLARRSARRLSGAGLVFGHGAANAAQEAAFLVTETLKLTPRDWKKRRLSARQVRAVEKRVEARIATRSPAAYIVKKMILQGIPFYVDSRVIVPRSFIAELLARDRVPHGGAVSSVLDLCSGSGCLAVIAAHAFPDARVDAAELSADACAVAKRNIRDSGLARRIKLYRGDLFTPVKNKKYDLIIANPPYVTPASMKKLPPEYRHEPRLALAGGGADGMDIVRRILKDAARHLTPGGGLLCEVGEGRDALEKSFPRLPFLWLDAENGAGEVFWLAREDMKA